MRRVVAVFETLLVHTKGRWARRPFLLEPFQRRIVEDVFGYVEFDDETQSWVRQHRIAWIELPRKNGKSEFMAGIALVLLLADDEHGAEIYSCAADREQARKVFDVAEQMVRLSPFLASRLKIMKQSRRIIYEQTGSWYQIISADALGNLGHNPHGVIFDEVVSQPDAGLWDAMRTAFGARRQPLMVAATTAGTDASSFAKSEHDYCQNVLDGAIEDPRRYVCMANAPSDADPFDEDMWATTNPALGRFLSLEAMRDEAREAANSPTKLNTFRVYRLNQWLNAHDSWLPLSAWDDCSASVDEAELIGRRCVGGLDLASTTDLAALCWLFARESDDETASSFDVVWRYWLPSERLADLDSRTAGAATTWAQAGLIELTEGNLIDHRQILAQIDRDAQRFDVAEIVYDRWGMSHLIAELGERGLTHVPFGQGYASMSPAAKATEEAVMAGRLAHGGNPVSRWMAANVIVRTDPAGNIKPDRQRSSDKIDGIVALVMAIGRSVTITAAPRESIYEARGLETA